MVAHVDSQRDIATGDPEHAGREHLRLDGWRRWVLWLLLAVVATQAVAVFVATVALTRYISLGSIEPQFYALLLELSGLGADPEFQHQMDQSKWPTLKEKVKACFILARLPAPILTAREGAEGAGVVRSRHSGEPPE